MVYYMFNNILDFHTIILLFGKPIYRFDHNQTFEIKHPHTLLVTTNYIGLYRMHI